MSKSDFSVLSIPCQSEYSEWLLKKHYARRIPSISFAFGLYRANALVGVCTFGTPASNNLCVGICGDEYSNQVIELNRLVIDCDEENIASWFVSRCLSMLTGGKIVVSYADTGKGHVGKVYQACNFLFTGTTKERTDIYSGEGKHSRHYDKSIDYSENRKIRTAKHRYVYMCGTRKQRKEYMKALRYPVLDYPKGDTNRYDDSYKPISQGVLF